ncbi:hypothetical protein AB0883_18805 [Micromonospora sp. NPDC047812]|uniref:hypothetical protein n=1 Tax=Micromonospora sp. NPDC047812 TaxID=3155742 RepID=UPI0034530476
MPVPVSWAVVDLVVDGALGTWVHRWAGKGRHGTAIRDTGRSAARAGRSHQVVSGRRSRRSIVCDSPARAATIWLAEAFWPRGEAEARNNPAWACPMRPASPGVLPPHPDWLLLIQGVGLVEIRTPSG